MKMYLVTLIAIFITVVLASDCSDMDKCWYQAVGQCPPNVTANIPSVNTCKNRLAVCKGYVKVCNKIEGINIVIDYDEPIPSGGICRGQLNECTAQIAGECYQRALGSNIITAVGGRVCPLKAICFADAKFCHCNTTAPSCEFTLHMSSGSTISANLFLALCLLVLSQFI